MINQSYYDKSDTLVIQKFRSPMAVMMFYLISFKILTIELKLDHQDDRLLWHNVSLVASIDILILLVQALLSKLTFCPHLVLLWLRCQPIWINARNSIHIQYQSFSESQVQFSETVFCEMATTDPSVIARELCFSALFQKFYPLLTSCRLLGQCVMNYCVRFVRTAINCTFMNHSSVVWQLFSLVSSIWWM